MWLPLKLGWVYLCWPFASKREIVVFITSRKRLLVHTWNTFIVKINTNFLIFFKINNNFKWKLALNAWWEKEKLKKHERKKLPEWRVVEGLREEGKWWRVKDIKSKSMIEEEEEDEVVHFITQSEWVSCDWFTLISICFWHLLFLNSDTHNKDSLRITDTCHFHHVRLFFFLNQKS